MYCSDTVLVDHASSVIIIYNQISLGSTNTIRSKDIYELQASELGIRLSTSRGDDIIYKLAPFQDELKKIYQNISIPGIGVYVKNKVHKRAIRKVVNSVRTMMLNQALM